MRGIQNRQAALFSYVSQLVQILYTIRSERLLMEQLDYNLLFRWFVGLSMDDEVWNHSVFSKNRDRLLEGDIAKEFLWKVLALAHEKKLLSDEHFDAPWRPWRSVLQPGIVRVWGMRQ